MSAAFTSQNLFSGTQLRLRQPGIQIKCIYLLSILPPCKTELQNTWLAGKCASYYSIVIPSISSLTTWLAGVRASHYSTVVPSISSLITWLSGEHARPYSTVAPSISSLTGYSGYSKILVNMFSSFSAWCTRTCAEADG